MNIIILSCLATLVYESCAYGLHSNSDTPLNKFGLKDYAGIETYQEPLDDIDIAYSSYDNNFGQTPAPDFYDLQFREPPKKTPQLDNILGPQPTVRPFSNNSFRQNGFQNPFFNLNVNPAEPFSRFNGPINANFPETFSYPQFDSINANNQEVINYPQFDSFNQKSDLLYEPFASLPYDPPTYQNVPEPFRPDNIQEPFRSPDFSPSFYRLPTTYKFPKEPYSNSILEPIDESPAEFISPYPQTGPEAPSYSPRSNIPPPNLQFQISSHHPADSVPSDHHNSPKTLDINDFASNLSQALKDIDFHKLLSPFISFHKNHDGVTPSSA